MFFPWIGIFEQIQLCDVYVHYDDVQFSKGGFTNRVQIKTSSSQGFNWLTVPLKKTRLGAKINEIEVDSRSNWQHQHLELLSQTYKNTLYRKDIIDIVNQLFDTKKKNLADLSKTSIEIVLNYFDLKENRKFYLSSELDINGKSSERVCKIVKHFDGTHYITGHGAKNYLDHALFEHNRIRVEYMDYLRLPYSQQYGAFNPHVSILDLIANLGKEGKKYIRSSTKYWREFLYESNQKI